MSSDEGETWSAASGAVTMALRGPVRALTGASDGSTLYAAAHTGLYLSTSAGADVGRPAAAQAAGRGDG